MTRRRIIGSLAIISAIAVVALATHSYLYFKDASNQSDFTPAITCTWSASDQDTNVTTQLSGPDDCQSAFAILADTGLNWTLGNSSNEGQLACSLSSGSESMKVYEFNYDSAPLVSSGASLCSAAEQSGWVPNAGLPTFIRTR